MAQLFTADDAWTGGFFELAMELGSRSDERLLACTEALWGHPSLHGCYPVRESEPEQSRRLQVRHADPESKRYGVASIPGLGATTCLSFAITGLSADDDGLGRDWLGLGLPMGSLGRIIPEVGGYPFGEGQHAWRWSLFSWLREVAQVVFDAVGFELGLVEHDCAAEVEAAEVFQRGIPAERRYGYLWPQEGSLTWHEPTA